MAENHNKKTTFLFFFSIISLIFLLWGCKTAPKVDEFGNPIPTYTIEEELDFLDVPKPYKYIFFRLYDLDYLNPFYIANVLKFGINATEVTDLTASHISINFSLDDDFWGLTSGGEYQIARESCTDTKSNKFMKKTDPEKSFQYTYAVRVSEDEYNKTKDFVEEYAANPDVRYKAGLNFKIASFATKRRFFTNKDHRQFGTVKYPKNKKPEKDAPDYVETDFVCSTFVAYTLMKNIDYIGSWFTEHNINYRYVGVTDIPQIPGIIPLFSSKFYEYLVAAEKFIEKYPEFQDYLTIVEPVENGGSSGDDVVLEAPKVVNE